MVYHSSVEPQCLQDLFLSLNMLRAGSKSCNFASMHISVIFDFVGQDGSKARILAVGIEPFHGGDLPYFGNDKSVMVYGF